MTDSLSPMPPEQPDPVPPDLTQVYGEVHEPTRTYGTPDPWSMPAEVLDAGVVPATARRGGRGLVALVAAAVAAVLVGGAALAWAAFSGDTGDQPEKHLPATAGAFVKVDLDPSGTQKIDAVRFLAKFPAGKDLQGSAGDDPRRFLYEQIARNDPSVPPWNDVEAWLGQRAAIGVVPGAAGDMTTVALLQATDESTAKASLAKGAAKDMAFAVADGWATISDTQAHVDAVARAAKAKALADDDTFRHDADALGDLGVLAGWADLTRFPQLGEALGRQSPLHTAGPLLGSQDLRKQRIGLVARFTGGNGEIALRTFGPTTTPPETGAGAAVTTLPDGTVAAVGVVGAGESVRTAWDALSTQAGPAGNALAQVEEQTGLKLPDDLVTLLGGRVSLALAQPDASGRPVFGLRGQSDAAGLEGALDRLLRYTDQAGLPLEHRKVSGGYVLATSRDQADALSKDGGFGGTDAFRDAVPDADKAQAVAYVDVERLAATYAKDVDADVAAYLKALRAIGLSIARTDDGTAVTLRVTTK